MVLCAQLTTTNQKLKLQLRKCQRHLKTWLMPRESWEKSNYSVSTKYSKNMLYTVELLSVSYLSIWNYITSKVKYVFIILSFSLITMNANWICIYRVLWPWECDWISGCVKASSPNWIWRHLHRNWLDGNWHAQSYLLQIGLDRWSYSVLYVSITQRVLIHSLC